MPARETFPVKNRTKPFRGSGVGLRIMEGDGEQNRCREQGQKRGAEGNFHWGDGMDGNAPIFFWHGRNGQPAGSVPPLWERSAEFNPWPVGAKNRGDGIDSRSGGRPEDRASHFSGVCARSSLLKRGVARSAEG
jgi:hypothetical protein